MPAYQRMSFHIETARLTMRSWAESDVVDYRALVAERDEKMPTAENIAERIATQFAATAETGIALLPIRRCVERDFVGYCGLTVGRANLDEPEIAFELLRRAHGRGYATEAARAVLDAATATGRTACGRRCAPGTRHHCGCSTSSGSNATTSRPMTGASWCG